MLDVNCVANSVLKRAFNEDIDVTPMKLQKMVYFLYAEYLNRTGKTLFSDRFEAWKYGPVIRSLYLIFNKYGTKPIKEYAVNTDGFAYVVSEEKSIEFKNALDAVWERCKDNDGVYLSTLTHRKGTAWYKAVTNGEPCLKDEDILADIRGGLMYG